MINPRRGEPSEAITRILDAAAKDMLIVLVPVLTMIHTAENGKVDSGSL